MVHFEATKVQNLSHIIKNEDRLAGEECGFYAGEPTSEAINEVHHSICVKSSHFNEPSMTCCTSNRLGVILFSAEFFIFSCAMFGMWSGSKIKVSE